MQPPIRLKRLAGSHRPHLVQSAVILPSPKALQCLKAMQGRTMAAAAEVHAEIIA